MTGSAPERLDGTAEASRPDQLSINFSKEAILMDQDKKQNPQQGQNNPQDPSRQGQQQHNDPSQQHNKEQDQRRQPGSNPQQDEGQKDRKTA
jgi:hypothetical protein